MRAYERFVCVSVGGKRGVVDHLHSANYGRANCRQPAAARSLYTRSHPPNNAAPTQHRVDVGAVVGQRRVDLVI
jgi:hypothetical protein